MNTTYRTQGKRERIGWYVLIGVAGVIAVNGAGWFYYGPTLSDLDPGAGTVDEFREAYPKVADTIATNARQVAIWFIGFGLLGVALGMQGLRTGDTFAWKAGWFVAVTPAAVGLNVLAGGEASFGGGMVLVGALAAVGLLLARPRGTPQGDPEAPPSQSS